MNGNYKLIDLKNIEIKSGSTGATIDGVYDAIDKATLPVKVINVNKNGTKLVANFGQGVRKSGGNYYVDLGDGTELKVTSANKVTYADKSSGGASDLGDLTDVTLNTPTNGQVLKYNSTSEKWENADLRGIVKLIFTDGTGTVDATLAKDVNSLEITVIESSETIVNRYTTGYVPIGADIDIAVANLGVLSAIYKVKYVGPIAGGLITKITLS